MNCLKVLVMGSINMDLTLRCNRIPSEGESVYGTAYSYSLGGKGANQAIACQRLGAETYISGCVGDDDNGNALLNKLKAESVNTDYINIAYSIPTGLAGVLLERNGNNRIISFSGANFEHTKSALENAFSQKYDYILMQLEMTEEIIVYCSELAYKNNIPVVLDAGPAQVFQLNKLKRLDILSPNKTEAATLTGMKIDSIKDCEQVAKKLYSQSNAEIILIKLGEDGSYLYTKDQRIHCPANIVKAVDTTAAGDCFTAAFSYHYFSVKNYEQALKFASAAAAITVTRQGAAASLPNIYEVEKFLCSKK